VAEGAERTRSITDVLSPRTTDDHADREIDESASLSRLLANTWSYFELRWDAFTA
jgi:hypothetical protein